ncbi:cytochrome d ubiquinol oxidase subunit II [Draconibacterium halophilum]|uniref:Cytochrome d ubiquinol oxidase subunit II n=1 Tax=Draconibacterium halophilum TaxID=2706887 RepID=A0A6C0RFU5_9BACT|nr:cytochrome d ubiquinol oxidase subunit II [Draconibacterium halophilum]QIA07941.1 cytochrome d ubiquinol oxidase subunit II [Draconibacterium halophilum]
MAEANLIILVICLLLYVILGGADFGGGILELLSRGKASKIVSRAIAPVWEANHVWLILVVVILFVGFPSVYSTILTALHIPVLLVLIGIIMRGSAFTFRQYDIEEEPTKAIYSAIFRFSSVFTTFFLGVTVGGLILGEISMNYQLGFYAVYIHPWLNWFSVSMGLFVVLLFAFLAGIFTVSEIEDKDYIIYFTRMTKRLLIALVVMGSIVFATAKLAGHSLLKDFINSSISVTCIVLATLALPAFWYFLNKNKGNWLRLTAGFQTILLVTGWFAIQFPVLVKTNSGHDITIQAAKAPHQTQFYLLIALVVGVLIIFPAMGYLYKTFKFSEEPES